MRIGDYIYTSEKVKFYPLDPREDEIFIKDIAHSLSLMCRGNGHTKHFYSVAQHSINCARESMLRGNSLKVSLGCLLHDASESYLADVTRPVKKELTKYLEIEDNLQSFIFKTLIKEELSTDDLERIKVVDDGMLKLEMKELLSYNEIVGEELVGEHSVDFVPMEKVEKEFINLYRELKEQSKF